MKNLVITICVLIVAAVVCNQALPEGAPTYDTLSINQESSMGDRAMARVGMMVIDWKVDNFVVFKVARGQLGGREFVLVTTPISEGKWHQIEREGR